MSLGQRLGGRLAVATVGEQAQAGRAERQGGAARDQRHVRTATADAAAATGVGATGSGPPSRWRWPWSAALAVSRWPSSAPGPGLVELGAGVGGAVVGLVGGGVGGAVVELDGVGFGVFEQVGVGFGVGVGRSACSEWP